MVILGGSGFGKHGSHITGWLCLSIVCQLHCLKRGGHFNVGQKHCGEFLHTEAWLSGYVVVRVGTSCSVVVVVKIGKLGPPSSVDIFVDGTFKPNFDLGQFVEAIL
jgi:hypothetical protein